MLSKKRSRRNYILLSFLGRLQGFTSFSLLISLLSQAAFLINTPGRAMLDK